MSQKVREMKKMKKLKTLRNKIDEIDKGVLQLLNQRASITLSIGNIKAKNSKPVFSPVREADV
jgi:chorismate mutase / prephenate dehydratase